MKSLKLRVTDPTCPPAGVLQAVHILLGRILKGPSHSHLLWVLHPLKAPEFVFTPDKGNEAILGIRELTYTGSREGPAISQRVNLMRVSASVKSHQAAALVVFVA